MISRNFPANTPAGLSDLPEPNHALAEAAFGRSPGSTPLPAPQSRTEQWLLAVVLAGQGHYAQAAALTLPLRDEHSPAALRSTALSLGASMSRQQGDHRHAMGLDMLALAALPAGAALQDPAAVLAHCDGLTGLAADSIGLGRLPMTNRILSSLSGPVSVAEAARFGWRARIRLSWVTAEAAMAGGDGQTAVAEARRGRELAHATSSLRHQVKSDLVAAAADACAGEPASAHAKALWAHERAEQHSLNPLAWACAMLLHALEPGHGWDERARLLQQRWT